MHSQTTVVLKTDMFEVGVFRSISAVPGELRRSVALSHFLAVTQTPTAIRAVGRGEQIATSARAMLYNRGCEYTARTVCSLREVTQYVRIPTEVLADAIRPHDPRVDDRGDRPLSFSDAPLTDAAFLSLRGLLRELPDRRVDRTRLDEKLVLLVREVIDAAYAERSCRLPSRQGVMDDEYVRRAQELLSLGFREQMPLEELGRRVGVSPFHLSRVFKRRVGMTICEFRECLRLRTAVDELVETGRAVAPIGLGLGFASPEQFADAFRRRFGFTPANARVLLRAGILHPAGRRCDWMGPWINRRIAEPSSGNGG